MNGWPLSPYRTRLAARSTASSAVPREVTRKRDLLSLRAVAREAPRAVEHGERTVRIGVHPNPGLDEVMPQRAFGKLQFQPLPGHRVVAVDDAIVVSARIRSARQGRSP